MKRSIVSLLLALLVSMGAWAQSTQVSGTVVDEQGVPFPGASVVVDGTTQGTISDMDGRFVLNVDNAKQKTLSVTCIGFVSVKFPMADQTSGINIVLKEETIALDEVVAVGYGTVTKKDLTGSVASVSAKQLEVVPVASASEAIQGKMAGVAITTTEGSPDADIKIRVRGGGSLSQDNSPLYIVDGFPVSSISDIAPTDIQSVDVLKDASSTAIYGARGANGVIIVTTKSGAEGKTQVNLGLSYGVRKVTRMVDVLDPYEYVLYQWELDQSSMSYGRWDDLEIWKSVEGTDHQDEVFGRTGNQQQYNVSISGGNKQTKYSISYARNEEKSIMVNSGFVKNNINAKINTELNKWLSFDFNARLTYQTVDGLSGGADSNESSATSSLISRAVVFKPVNELTADSEDEENTMNAQYTPRQRLDDTYKKKAKFQQNYNAGLNWQPVKGLKFRSEYGYGYTTQNTDQVWGSRASVNSKYGYSGAPQALMTKVISKSWRNANTVTYDNKKLFGGRDHLNVVVGQEMTSDYDTKTVATSVGFATDMTIGEVLAAMGNGVALPTETYIGIKDNMFSFFGRLNYTLMDRYMLSATVRADGSSKFSDGNRWGYFPSAALAWRLSDEEFMASTREWLTNLKLRLSYGTAGNNRIPDGSMYTTFALSSTSDKHIYFDESAAIDIKHGDILSNPDLTWETTVTRNVGVDYGFFNNRISGSVDVYWNTTKDLLMKTTISSSSGYSYQYRNIGQTSNRGVELQLDAVLLDSKDYGLNFNFNISYNRGKIDELPGGDMWQMSGWGAAVAGKSEDFLVAEGGRLGEVWGFKADGYYKPEDFDWDGSKWVLKESQGADASQITYNSVGVVPGALKLKTDENGDVVKVRLGNTVPKVSGGFGLNGRFKWFDASIFCNYSLGNKILNATKVGSSFYEGSKKNWNLNDDFRLANRYTVIDPESGESMISKNYVQTYGYEEVANRLNQLNAGKSMYNPASVTSMPLTDYALEDGSFLRINTVSVGYTLPKAWVEKCYLSNVRFYVTGYNLYCFTNYSGADPEVDTRRSTPMTPGVDYSAYPKSRTFVGGVNVSF